MIIRTCVESVKVKRIFSVVVVAALALVLGIALSPQKDDIPETQRTVLGINISHATTTQHRLAVFIESYVETYTGSGEIKEIVQTIGEEDYTTPKAVYAITASAEQIAAYAGVDALSDASNELQKTMENKFIVALISQVNGMAGAMNLAAASVCTSGKTFVSDEISESVIYLYTFDDARPISVTFTCGEDNTVSASGMFMMNDEFPCDSVAEIEEFFGEVGVNVSEVKG